MEKDKNSLAKEVHRREIRLANIADHLDTLIRYGYVSTTSNFPLLTIPANKKSENFSMWNPEMKEETAWRRWRTKMHNSDVSRSRNFYTNEIENTMGINGPVRRHGVGISYGEFQTPESNIMYPSWNRNPVRFNNMRNGTLMQQIPQTTKDFNQNESKNKSSTKNLNSSSTFTDYCYHCTIHGLKYIGDKSLPNFERIFWIFSFLMAIFGAAYFIWHLYAKYLLAPIIISRSSESVSIDQFPFPALTVCNMNNAKRSVAQDIMKGNNSLQKFFLEDICNSKTNLTYDQRDITEESGEWENIYQFLLNVSQDCSQMLHFCQWHGNTTNCSEIFNPILTDEGLCCKFNSVPRLLYDPRSWDKLRISYASEKHIDWNPEYIFTKNDPATAIPWRAYGSGASYGLTLALDVDADEYFCSSTASVGFKMLLHSPVENPQINDFGFTLSPGKETRVIITPHITEADKSIMKIPPKKRRCYFLNEKNLRYYRTYTQRNCLLECEANFTLKYCQCMQYYMSVSNDTRICGKNDDECAINARKFMKNKLYEEDEVKPFNFTEAPSCKCYPGCNEINYSTEISQSMLLATFEVPEEYFKYDAAYFEKNIAVVHIFFIDDSYMKYTKKELYGFAELLSNTGGLLGLFMGFSLLSVIEIVYYFTIRLWWRMLKKKKIKDNKNKFTIQPFIHKYDTTYPFVQ